jgi:hypothetical protein
MCYIYRHGKDKRPTKRERFKDMLMGQACKNMSQKNFKEVKSWISVLKFILQMAV